MNYPADDTEDDARPSKSQRKRDMTALQDLGEQLVALSADRLARVELPERLRDAVVEAQRIRNFEARRRQLQYIGKLMREIDPAPIRARLDAWQGVTNEIIAQQHLIERWRERLIADDTALTEFASAYPGCDIQHLRSLISSIKRDLAQKKPPKNYRELFRTLRNVIAPPAVQDETE